MASRPIPLSHPDLTAQERAAVARVLRGPTLSLGPELDRFEKALRCYLGAGHCVAVSSGTAALHLTLAALGLGAGDEVITTPLSFVASGNCCLYVGAHPRFVDVEAETGNISFEQVRRAFTQRTRMLLLVHLFGLPCDMAPLMRWARQHRVIVVEDACEALGATYRGKKAGTFGKVSVFGFYPNKQLTTGEGGAVVTASGRVASLCRSLRNQGRARRGSWLQHDRLGYNYRLDEMSAALGAVQLRRLKGMLERREQVARWYAEELRELDEVILPAEVPGRNRSWFVYVIRLRSKKRRDRALRQLRRRGIGCSVYFPPLHQMPHYQRLGYRRGDFPESERWGREALALPFHTRLKRSEVRRVVATLTRALA